MFESTATAVVALTRGVDETGVRVKEALEERGVLVDIGVEVGVGVGVDVGGV